MKEKKKNEQEEFLEGFIGETKNAPEAEKIFGDEDFEHGEEEINALEIFEHEALSTDEIFESLAKVTGKNPEEVRKIWQRGIEAEEKSEKEREDSGFFEELGKLRGTSGEEMKNELLWVLKKANMDKLVGEIMENNPGMNRKTAEELAKFRLDAGKMKKEEEKGENWSEKLRELDVFLSKHSGEAIEKLAGRVVEDWEGGIPLEIAFERHRLSAENEKLLAELEQLKSEKAMEEQRAYAKKHTPGSATSTAGLAVRDEFIEGLFKEY